MSDPVSSNTATSSAYGVTGGTMFDDAAMTAMSPEDIMNYVRAQLGSIDAQMADYKTIVDARRQKSAEIREAMALFRELRSGKGEVGKIDQEKYDHLMTLLAKNSDIPSVKSAFDKLTEHYGGYTATESFKNIDDEDVEKGMQQGPLSASDYHVPQYLTDENGNEIFDINGQSQLNPNWNPPSFDLKLTAEEAQGILDNAREGMEGLNSDNEMIMMGLQKLMQQRNQISQFASNALNSHNEAMKGIIGNIR